jgi:hypothetical protein
MINSKPLVREKSCVTMIGFKEVTGTNDSK